MPASGLADVAADSPYQQWLGRLIRAVLPKIAEVRKRIERLGRDIWLEVDGQYVFGRGISEILKAVERTGSIKAAAHALGVHQQTVKRHLVALRRWAGVETNAQLAVVLTRAGE